MSEEVAEQTSAESSVAESPVSKTCSKCGEDKLFNEFHRNSSQRDGLRSECKVCRKIYHSVPKSDEAKENLRKRKKKWAGTEKGKRLAKQHNERYKASRKGVAAARKSHLKRNYNITPDTYNAMVSSQKGLCAICGESPSNGGNLYVDHDHKTNEVRSLLCNNCNLAIGLVKEDVVILANAIAYIGKHNIDRRENERQVG